MFAFLADENFDGRIVRGLARRWQGLDIVRVQHVGLVGTDDPTILGWAADAGRVLLTHDAATMSRHAYARTEAGLHMPGVLEVRRSMPIGQAVDEILPIAECLSDDELDGQVYYIPL